MVVDTRARWTHPQLLEGVLDAVSFRALLAHISNNSWRLIQYWVNGNWPIMIHLIVLQTGYMMNYIGSQSGTSVVNYLYGSELIVYSLCQRSGLVKRNVNIDDICLGPAIHDRLDRTDHARCTRAKHLMHLNSEAKVKLDEKKWSSDWMKTRLTLPSTTAWYNWGIEIDFSTTGNSFWINLKFDHSQLKKQWLL